MVVLTDRQRCLLRALCAQGSFVTLQTLAEHMQVSVRTIRTDLGYIEDYIAGYRAALVRRSGVGVKIDATPSVVMELSRVAEERAAREPSKRERLIIMETMLLTGDENTVKKLADSCGVSRAMASELLCDVERRLRLHEIELVRERGAGVYLRASELDIRRCFMQMLNTGVHSEVIESIVSQAASGCALSRAADLLDRAGLERDISPEQGNALRIAFPYVLTRIESGHLLESGEFGIQDAGHPSLKSLVESFEASVSVRQEAEYLAMLVLSGRVLHGVSDKEERELIDDEAAKIARELTGALSALHAIDDAKIGHVIDGMTAHVRAAIYRCRNDIQIQDEVPCQLAVSLPLLYEFTKHLMIGIERRHGIAFNESELAYIAMYLETIYEASVSADIRLNVLFICSFGLASSVILKTRLQRILSECAMVGPCSMAEAASYLADNEVDFIISTGPFEYGSIPVIEVDPLLSHGDVVRISAQLSQRSYSKLCAHFLDSYEQVRHSGADVHRVSDYVLPQDILFADGAISWREAIRKAARPLLERGVIEARYVDAMIQAVVDFGPYMILTPGTAYVHAGGNDGIHENCSSVLVLDREISFGDVGEKLVRAIVVLGIKDRDRADLINLAYIFAREENVAALSNPKLDAGKLLAFHD